MELPEPALTPSRILNNSSFNPFDRDPTATVRHGLQTSDEMMFGFLFFTRDDEALNLTIDPKTGHVIEN